MVIRTWKIKLKNGRLAKDVFRSWFNDHKYSYNKAVWLQNSTIESTRMEYVNQDIFDTPYSNDESPVEYRNVSSCYYSAYDTRNLIVPSEVNQHAPWLLETPKDIRAEAVFECRKNLDACITNKKNGNISNFTMGYMKKKQKVHNYCFNVPGSAIKVFKTSKKYDDRKRVTIYSSYTNNFKFHLSKAIPSYMINDNGTLKSSHQIKFNGINYYLHLTVDREYIPIINRKKTVSTDPGIRKMITTWDPSDTTYKFGSNKFKQVKDLLKKRDRYQSLGNKMGYIQIEQRIKNLMSELHHQTGTYLCKRYRNIILPELNVKELVKKVESREYRKALLRMKLCEFNNLLKAKGELYNTRIISNSDGVNEAYSSRMCSRCKHINPRCSNEVKRCQNCHLVIDRDINGAKNIYYFNKHLV